MPPIKVLHVDDCDDVRTVVGITLSGMGGMKVTQSASGPEAIEAMWDTEADILLLDVMMPEISGPELLNRLRTKESLRDVPAVFLTAKSAPEDIEMLMQAGATAVITKPFDAVKLPEDLARILADHRAGKAAGNEAAKENPEKSSVPEKSSAARDTKPEPPRASRLRATSAGPTPRERDEKAGPPVRPAEDLRHSRRVI